MSAIVGTYTMSIRSKIFWRSKKLKKNWEPKYFKEKLREIVFCVSTESVNYGCNFITLCNGNDSVFNMLRRQCEFNKRNNFSLSKPKNQLEYVFAATSYHFCATNVHVYIYFTQLTYMYCSFFFLVFFSLSTLKMTSMFQFRIIDKVFATHSHTWNTVHIIAFILQSKYMNAQRTTQIKKVLWHTFSHIFFLCSKHLSHHCSTHFIRKVVSAHRISSFEHQKSRYVFLPLEATRIKS